MTGQDHIGLSLSNLSVEIAGKRLFDISADIGAGETLTIMGASGSGKSTLISAVAGFLDPAFSLDGQVTLNGVEITSLPPEKRQVGVLFQDPLLFPHFSVAENLLFALPPGGNARERRERIAQLLTPVGLIDLIDRDPSTLSGGQAARVALLRVIASSPKALLLDEPFSKLDMTLRSAVRDFVFECVDFQQLPTLLVTHDHADHEAVGGELIAL